MGPWWVPGGSGGSAHCSLRSAGCHYSLMQTGVQLADTCPQNLLQKKARSNHFDASMKEMLRSAGGGGSAPTLPTDGNYSAFSIPVLRLRDSVRLKYATEHENMNMVG